MAWLSILLVIIAGLCGINQHLYHILCARVGNSCVMVFLYRVTKYDKSRTVLEHYINYKQIN